MDLATTKKTPTLGLHRIAKLLGNENKMNRSAETSRESKDEEKKMLDESKVKSIPGRTGGGWGRVVLSRNIKSTEPKTVEVTPPLISDNKTNATKRDTNYKNGTSSTTVSILDTGNSDLNVRCNGRLQRTKRIDDGDAGDDQDSIASVTIISVPSSMVTPVTSSDHNSPDKGHQLKIENCNSTSISSASGSSSGNLLKQSSLPPPTLSSSSVLQTLHPGKRCQTPNSGWL